MTGLSGQAEDTEDTGCRKACKHKGNLRGQAEDSRGQLGQRTLRHLLVKVPEGLPEQNPWHTPDRAVDAEPHIFLDTHYCQYPAKRQAFPYLSLDLSSE